MDAAADCRKSTRRQAHDRARTRDLSGCRRVRIVYRLEASGRGNPECVRRRDGKPIFCGVTNPLGLAGTDPRMSESREAAGRAREVLGLLGFLMIATAQVS